MRDCYILHGTGLGGTFTLSSYDPLRDVVYGRERNETVQTRPEDYSEHVTDNHSTNDSEFNEWIAKE